MKRNENKYEIVVGEHIWSAYIMTAKTFLCICIGEKRFVTKFKWYDCAHLGSEDVCLHETVLTMKVNKNYGPISWKLFSKILKVPKYCSSD